MSLARSALSALSRVAPGIAAELAWRRWRQVGTPVPVHPRDAATHSRAVRETVTVNGRTVAAYRWGSGAPVVILAHGWHSRASRFSALVDALESGGATVLAFDAPANGDSPGRLVTVLDYADAIRQLAERHGPVRAIVGHSFGVLASFLAVREGVATPRLVAIAGMADAHLLVDSFADAAGLSAATRRGMRRRIERRTFPEVADPWSRFVSRLEEPSGVEVLVVHDEGDPVVPVAQAERIAAAHGGRASTLITTGLGHSRLLSDPAVVDAVTAFALTPSETPSRSSASSRGTP